jgi:hypothetical protein
VSLNPTTNPHTKKPYSRGSQPYVIHRWLDGYTEPGWCRPKQHLPWRGIMQDPDVKSVEFRDDRLFAFGHFVARRGPGKTIEVNFAVPDGSVAMVARRVVACAERRGINVVAIGPNGTPRQAAEMALHAVEKMLRRTRPMNQWGGPWRLQQATLEVARAGRTGLIPTERLRKAIVLLKAKVTRGRMEGWSESACATLMAEINKAEQAMKHYAVAA